MEEYNEYYYEENDDWIHKYFIIHIIIPVFQQMYSKWLPDNSYSSFWYSESPSSNHANATLGTTKPPNWDAWYVCAIDRMWVDSGSTFSRLLSPIQIFILECCLSRFSHSTIEAGASRSNHAKSEAWGG